MGRVSRGGYWIVWWIGDHEPRHVHVYDQRENFLGRVVIATKEPLDHWIPPREVIEIIEQLQQEGRL